MKLYFAPMEGITDYIFRNAHSRFYGGVDSYYSPFVSANHTYSMQSKEKLDIEPENNININLVPQILTNDADQCIWAVNEMRDRGYGEININIGCPSGTVTSKYKGAGLLRDLDRLDDFLDKVFSDENSKDISVKTRLGYEDKEDALKLIDIYNKYPLSKLIIHARVRADFYKGDADLDVFERMYEKCKCKVVYNGDICSKEKYEEIADRFKNLEGIMIGRGLIAKPFLAEEIKDLKDDSDEKKRFKAFHDVLLKEITERLGTEKYILGRMKEYWYYWQGSYCKDEKSIKNIKKASCVNEYKAAVVNALI